MVGWSSRDLAAHAGVTPNTVTNLEMGRPVRLSTLDKIRAAFTKAGLKFTVTRDGVGVHIAA